MIAAQVRLISDMGRNVARSIVPAILLTALLLVPQAVLAQAPPPPNPQNVDERGIELTTGRPLNGFVDLSIGPGDHRGLQLSRQYTQDYWRLANVPTLSGSTSAPIVSFGGRSVPFTGSTSSYAPVYEDGSTLVWDGSKYIYTGADGVSIEFGHAGYPNPHYASNLGLGSKVTFADGVVWNYHYNQGTHTITQYVCYPAPVGCQTVVFGSYSFGRLASVTSSTGYQIKLAYASNNIQTDLNGWLNLVGAKAINNAVEYCDPVAGSCSLSGTWPEIAYSGGGASVTDPVGRTTTYTVGGGNITGIKPPGASANAVTYSYTGNKVSSVAVAGAGTWTYSYGTNTTTVTDPASQTRTVNFNSGGQVTSVVAGGQTTTYQYCTGGSGCPAGLLQTATMPEGNYVTYTYDARGNVTSTVASPKPSVGGSTITTSAAYPSTCSNPLTCNKPVSTTDARGKVTDYTYDATHGGLLTVTAPADAGGVRPQTRITYATKQARYLTGPSTWTVSAQIPVPVSTSTCRTATSGNPASCVGTADEQVSEIAYPVNTTPNNLNPVSVTTKAGNGTLAATTTPTWDDYGRVVTVDGPLSGTADTARVRYNLAGQVLGVVSPDPDDGGTAKFPATRYSYNAWGQAYLVESGTVNGLSDSDWAAFSATGNTLTEYDTHGRPVRQKARNGTTDYQVVDTVYGTAGRVSCTVQRMSPGSWGTVASSCTPPQAGDRVVFNTYDALGRVTKVTSGYGTSVAADDRTVTFTNNGQVATATDAEQNRTTYEYDGHDRLVKTRFPHPSTKNTSSTTDYEEVTYDAGGNVLTFRTRRNETLTLTYDNLSRLVTKAVPNRSGLDTTHTRDVYFGYDLFGNMTWARFDSTGGQGVTNAFNALGQLTSSTVNLDGVSRALSYQYDVAGNFTRITHPDSNYVQYTRHPAGALSQIALNGSSPLTRPLFDTAGRLNHLERRRAAAGDWATKATFGYDAVSRVSSIATDLAGTTHDTTTSFTWNPASQLASVTRTNDLYAWSGALAIDRDYTANGLNQYSVVGGTSFTHDANGNLTSDGTQTYVYDVENRLVSRSGGGTSATLRYDPLGRLYEVNGSVTGVTRFLYDGSDLVAEYNGSGTLLRRYVHGLSAGDDPLVWFEGSGVADGARRYLYADERGSIVAVTDSAGNVLGLNSYDEYGIPGSANAGRFQYTGQAWLPELGMYHYKARMYSPTLGRFMQTDPIGYGDGMNMYAYVGNDPVNGVDPSGLCRKNALPPSGSDLQYWACIDGQWVNTMVVTAERWRPYNASPPPTGLYDMMNRMDRAAAQVAPAQGNWNQNAGSEGSRAPVGEAPQSEPPCRIADPAARRAYARARSRAFERFNENGQSREEGYAVWRHNETGRVTIHWRTGQDGYVGLTPRANSTLLLHGHIHNRPVGPNYFLGFFPYGWNYAGPSEGPGSDMESRSHPDISSATFVLHQSRNGEWEDVCY